jgi:TetR/AcrR family transcriptional regulator
MSSPPPSLSPGQNRQQEIVHVAIDVFGESGFGGARIDEVARRVGIRRPSILYHFPDKQNLYQAAIGEVVREIADRIRETETESGDRLEAIIDTWIDFVIQWPNAARLLLRQMIDSEPMEIRDARPTIDAVFRAIAAAIEEQAGPEQGKPIEVVEFTLVLASTSLVWVASRSAVEGALGIDTLSPQAVQRHRRMLHNLMRQQWMAARETASERSASGLEEPQARRATDATRAGLQ